MRGLVATTRVATWYMVRDPLLRLMAVMPVAVALLFRLVLPPADRALGAVFESTVFRLSDYYPVISSFLVQLAGLFAGGVAGFTLLDERDEGVLEAISVTPVGRGGYLTARLLVPTALAVFGAVVSVPVAGFYRPAFPTFALAIVAAAPLAPVTALTLTAFARDKVEGLAAFKMIGLLYLGPAVVLLPERFHAVGWPLASYWASRVYLADAGGSVPLPASALWGFAAALLCALCYALPAVVRIRRY